MKLLKTCLAVTSACLLAGGVAFAQSGSSSATSGSRGSAGAAEKSGQPTDAEIAHIVVTANQIDIDAGKQAMKKTRNAEVKAFAKQMVDDHTSVNEQAGDLAKKLGVTPKPNETSKSLQSDAKEKMAELARLKGQEFDRAYVEHEVAYHQAVIKAVDEALIPNAQNEELKSLITQVRPALQKHLEHAEHLQQTLASGGASASGGSGHGGKSGASAGTSGGSGRSSGSDSGTSAGKSGSSGSGPSRSSGDASQDRQGGSR